MVLGPFTPDQEGATVPSRDVRKVFHPSTPFPLFGPRWRNLAVTNFVTVYFLWFFGPLKDFINQFYVIYCAIIFLYLPS